MNARSGLRLSPRKRPPGTSRTADPAERRDARLLSEVLGFFVRALFAFQRRTSRRLGVSRPLTGALASSSASTSVPRGGAGGGRGLATGMPEQVAAVEASHTGRYLARVLERARTPRPVGSAQAPEQAAAAR